MGKSPWPWTPWIPPREVAGQYRVMVVKRPFGMAVQNHGLPRVVDVQPWSAAAETAVRCGLVVTAINDLAVDFSTWLKAFTMAEIPCSP